MLLPSFGLARRFLLRSTLKVSARTLNGFECNRILRSGPEVERRWVLPFVEV